MKQVRRWGWIVLLAALLGGYWLLPISGQVLVLTGGRTAGVWPQIRLDPPAPRPGAPVAVRVSDTQPWTYVLLTVDGQAVDPQIWGQSSAGVWTWTWELDDLPAAATLAFYHDCHTGCVERGRFELGAPRPPAPPRVPTKLGAVFADPERDWHGLSGWDVELTYAQMAEDPYWGIDDLAWRVQQAAGQGLRVLVRLDYDQEQSIPPTGDYLALSLYLEYLARLARDERLAGVYGYVLGSGYNSLAANALAPENPVTPEWYARLFNGYGAPPTRADNAVQVMRAVDPHLRVLVGPVRPWSTDQDGARPWQIDAPWLNYMNTLVGALDAAATERSALGIPLAGPDGFALHAPGRIDAPGLDETTRASEPHMDLRSQEWGAAQAGFRVYRDWLAVINAYPTTRGRPALITSTNTATRLEVPPAQNYVPGWLEAALDEVRAEPQIQALCWFVDRDRSGAQTWDWFSLSQRSGRLIDAADEFDRLLAMQER